MWLLTTFITALVASLLYILLKKKYKLGFLSLMLWGATIMILIDQIIGYDGGQFLEQSTDGLINNSIMLGVVMLLPVLIIWIVVLFVTKFQTHDE